MARWSSLMAAAALAGIAVPAAAQDSVSVVVNDTVVVEEKQDEDEGSGITFTGYVTGSYTWASKHDGGTIVGRYYERNYNQFTLNAVKLVVEKAVETGTVNAGFRVDGLFGQNAEVTQAANFDLGEDGDITQAFVTLNLPTGKESYLQLRLGKYTTLMGYEVIEDVVNPNFSVGNLFVFVENFTQTGAGAFWKLNPVLDVSLHVLNGWDVVKDNNSALSLMGRVGITPSASAAIGLLGYYGPEQTDNNSNKRYGGEVLGTFKLGATTSVVVQGDVGWEEGLLLPSTDKANWWGVSGWLVFDASPALGIALRGDYVNDKDGVRTSNYFYPPAPSRKFGSGTATVTVRAIRNLLIRPEVRVDFSDLEDYGPVGDAAKSQVSVALGTSYIF